MEAYGSDGSTSTASLTQFQTLRHGPTVGLTYTFLIVVRQNHRGFEGLTPPSTWLTGIRRSSLGRTDEVMAGMVPRPLGRAFRPRPSRSSAPASVRFSASGRSRFLPRIPQRGVWPPGAAGRVVRRGYRPFETAA